MSSPFPTEQPDNGNPGPMHIPKRQVSRQTQDLNQQEVYKTPADFDDRAKDNAKRIAEIHEFRRENIKHYDPPKKDFFDYDPAEKSRRYDALKLESVFKFESTYKALKWGVAVGSMFAFHRYYRTRNVNNAAHWFAMMSCISFFNIWLSYSLQEFVLDYGSRKSLSIAQRNEYHENAYNYYVDRVTQETKLFDQTAEPVLVNETGRAIDYFLKCYKEYMQNKYETQAMSAQEVVDELSIYST